MPVQKSVGVYGKTGIEALVVLDLPSLVDAVYVLDGGVRSWLTKEGTVIPASGGYFCVDKTGLKLRLEGGGSSNGRSDVPDRRWVRLEGTFKASRFGSMAAGMRATLMLAAIMADCCASRTNIAVQVLSLVIDGRFSDI